MRLKQIVKRLPISRYVDAVEKGTEQQRLRAEQARQNSTETIEALRTFHRQNHFSEMVSRSLRTAR